MVIYAVYQIIRNQYKNTKMCHVFIFIPFHAGPDLLFQIHELFIQNRFYAYCSNTDRNMHHKKNAGNLLCTHHPLQPGYFLFASRVFISAACNKKRENFLSFLNLKYDIILIDFLYFLLHMI